MLQNLVTILVYVGGLSHEYVKYNVFVASYTFSCMLSSQVVLVLARPIASTYNVLAWCTEDVDRQATARHQCSCTRRLEHPEV